MVKSSKEYLNGSRGHRSWTIPPFLSKAKKQIDGVENEWDAAWHAQLLREWRAGSEASCLLLLAVAAVGARCYPSVETYEDEWSDVTQRLIEHLDRWDPAQSSWVTFLRSRLHWAQWRRKKKERSDRIRHARFARGLRARVHTDIQRQTQLSLAVGFAAQVH